jgi:hypothetical protein
VSLLSAISSRDALITEFGKNYLNIKYPKEFELYTIALELTDETFSKTLKYFIFPVNPSSIEENKPQLDNVKKTLSGVSVLKTPTFVPTDISLTGTFGRGFKVLLGSSLEDFIHSFQERRDSALDGSISYRTTNDSFTKGVEQVFDDRIKTGYGCIKILEEIVQESKKLGKNGEVRKLIFHNPALGNSYLVSAGNLRLFQNEQTNMIWNYTLSLKSIAPLESLYNKQDLEKMSTQLNIANYMQKRVNAIVRTASKLLGDTIDRIPQS